MAGGNRFVIKYHASLLNLEALMEVFPGAQVLMGHREFSECIPSLASLAKVTPHTDLTYDNILH